MANQPKAEQAGSTAACSVRDWCYGGTENRDFSPYSSCPIRPAEEKTARLVMNRHGRQIRIRSDDGRWDND